MATSEAQKQAFAAAGMSNAEVLKRAATRMTQGDDLRRDYDAATNTLIDP